MVPREDAAVTAVQEDEHARLLALLQRSTNEIGDALADARRVHEELAALLAISQRRRLDPRERGLFDELDHDERLAAKRYLAARHWRDAVIRRLQDLRLDDDEAAGPAA